MSHKRYRPSKKAALFELCSQPGEDDGVDPRRSSGFQHHRDASRDRKTLQLCQQVAHAVEFVLTSMSHDDDVSGLQVLSVIPGAHRGKLLVTLTPGPIASNASVAEILAKVQGLSGKIRAEVCDSITRKMTPELMFAYVPSSFAEERKESEDRHA